MQSTLNTQLPPVPPDLEGIEHVGLQRRVYQVWQGSNRFFLGGRLIFGPDVRSLLLTIVMILAPAAVFYKFVALDLLEMLPGHWGLTVMVVAGALIVFVLLFLFLTSSRDPGIVPRNKHPPEPDNDFDISNVHSDCNGRQTPYLRLPRTKDVIVNGIAVKIKYCDTCMLYRPPRCSHCSICNNCVERFDHHCPWVGQCIGQRNYLFFIIFISITSVLCLFIFTMSAILVKKIMDEPKRHMIWKALAKSPASIFLMIYSFCAIWFVGGLTLFHLYLISKNQTTYENFRYRYEKKVNPYDKGATQNFRQALCAGIPPSKNNFRAKIAQEDEPISSSSAFADRQLHHHHHHHHHQAASPGQDHGLSISPQGVLLVSPSPSLKDQLAASGHPPLPLGTPDGDLSEHWSSQSDKWDVAAAADSILSIAENMLWALPAHDHDVEDTPPVRDKISSPPQQLEYT